MRRRAVIIVLDGFGIGALPDADMYGDKGSDTLGNMARAAGGLRIPVLESLGLGCIEGVTAVEKAEAPLGAFGRMSEASPGKDTATGHWEMAGIVLERPFPTFPEGFPPEVMDGFSRLSGRGWLCNRPASGTQVIDDFGAEHLKTGDLIVYTSADSVFQIAAHEGVVPLEELYRVCARTRELLYPYNVGRVIARPFCGEPGSFERTANRRDWPVEPPGETLLQVLKDKGLDVTGIGKIGDIFVHKGLTLETHTKSDEEGLELALRALESSGDGLIFVNLVDLDTQYGHRNDPKGYARELEAIDARLKDVMAALGEDDVLFITGDHGCDPTTPSTDHSREYVPVLAYGRSIRAGADLGTRESFSDLGATVAEFFGASIGSGGSFLHEMRLKAGNADR